MYLRILDKNRMLELTNEDVNKIVEDTRTHIKSKGNENYFAKLLAVNVRNAMEGSHCKYLSDKQMKELNPIIRNAIYTALVHINEDISYVGFYEQYIPDYWEDCEILHDKSFTFL